MNQIGIILEQHEATGMSVALCLSEQIACAKQVQQRGIVCFRKKKENPALAVQRLFQASVKEYSRSVRTTMVKYD